MPKSATTIKFSNFFIFLYAILTSFLDILANFNLLRTLKLIIFWTFIAKYLWSPLIFLGQSLGENGRKWRHSVKIPDGLLTGWNYNITISTAIRIKNIQNFASHIRSIFFIVIVKFQPMWYFEKMTSFSQILNQDLGQGKLMAAVNSRK